MSDETPDSDDDEEMSEEAPPREARGPTGGATGFSNRPDRGREEPEEDPGRDAPRDPPPAQEDRDRREPDWWLQKKVLVSAGVLALLFLASLALFWPASSMSIGADPVATEIAADLAEEGIDDALVDVTDERALVRYDPPSDMNTEESWLVVLDSLQANAVDSEMAVLQVYDTGDPRQEVEADMDDVESYFDARISWDELRNRMSVRNVR